LTTWKKKCILSHILGPFLQDKGEKKTKTEEEEEKKNCTLTGKPLNVPRLRGLHWRELYKGKKGYKRSVWERNRGGKKDGKKGKNKRGDSYTSPRAMGHGGKRLLAKKGGEDG